MSKQTTGVKPQLLTDMSRRACRRTLPSEFELSHEHCHWAVEPANEVLRGPHPALPTCTVAWKSVALKSRVALARGIQQGRCIVNAGGVAVTGGRADSTRIKRCIRHTHRGCIFKHAPKQGGQGGRSHSGANNHTAMGLEVYNACESVTHQTLAQGLLAVSDLGLEATVA